MSKIANIFIGILLFMFTALASADDEAVVSLSKKKIKSNIGSTVTVDLQMSEFPVTEGGGVNIRYNPRVVQINNVTVDASTWNFVNQNGNIDNAYGIVSNILFSSFRGVSGDARIATIELEFVGRGKSKIRLEASDDNPFASNGEPLDVKFRSTRIRVRK